MPCNDGGVVWRRGDGLQHHSMPGVYWVQETTRAGKIIVLDPHGERHRLWPDYVADNFTRIDPLPGSEQRG